MGDGPIKPISPPFSTLALVVRGRGLGNSLEAPRIMGNISQTDTTSRENGIEIPLKRKRVRRICLKCEQTFLANGTFNRICPLCRRTNREINSECLEIEVHCQEWIDRWL